MLHVTRWLHRARRLARLLRLSDRLGATSARLAIAVVLASAFATALRLPLLGAGALAVALWLVVRRPFDGSPSKRPFIAELDARRGLEDRLRTATELEAENDAAARPFVKAQLEDARHSVERLRRPLLGGSRICAVWMLWAGLVLGLLPRPSELPKGSSPSASLPPVTAATGGAVRASGSPLASGPSGADTLPEEPPQGEETESLPPEPIDLEGGDRTAKFVTPDRQDGDQHEKEVTVQEQEVAPKPKPESKLTEAAPPETTEQPLVDSDDRIRRSLLPPSRRELLRRYFERRRR
ncbi:MAG: hypothetical protein RL885_18465 [Planctomycetota bacterium]